MITFLICLALLVAAYFGYGAYLDKICKIDKGAAVPSATLYDGVDYIPMPRWRTFLIQLLNIAGLGPIFGALLGAAYGPVAFLWITLGGIFMGALTVFMHRGNIQRLLKGEERKTNLLGKGNQT